MAEGVRKGLQAVANSRGVIAALAMDPQSALRKLLTQAESEDCLSRMGPENIARRNACRDAATPWCFAALDLGPAERAQERMI
jgi:tagatose-1,6-bisphosphate aldolase